MASTINASNSGFGGIVSTGDSSGVLTLQSAGTTAVTLDTSQNATFAGKVTSAGALTLASNGTTTAVTIDTSQNVGIATTSPNVRLNVVGSTTYSGITNGTAFFQAATGTTSDSGILLGSINGNTPFIAATNLNGGAGSATNFVFLTNATERMRIDSSGNVLIGTTSTSTSDKGLRLLNNAAGFMQISATKTFSGSLNYLLNYHNGTYVGGIDYTNTATSFPTSSDIRLKKDIVDAPSATQKIDNIRIVSHGWKHDDEVVDFGIIAQELYEIMPRAVTKGDDGEEIETTWGVDYSKLVPMLIKAHQEQQTIINDLKARVETLENKE